MQRNETAVRMKRKDKPTVQNKRVPKKAHICFFATAFYDTFIAF
jgi:hypothetical protein